MEWFGANGKEKIGIAVMAVRFIEGKRILQLQQMK
jgi:hypothetical protein